MLNPTIVSYSLMIVVFGFAFVGIRSECHHWKVRRQARALVLDLSRKLLNDGRVADREECIRIANLLDPSSDIKISTPTASKAHLPRLA